MSKSPTTTTKANLLPNPHPGEILLEEFLKPMGLSQNALARAIHVPPRRINEIVLGKSDVTADTDLRLARYFGMSQGFFSVFRPITILWNGAGKSAPNCNLSLPGRRKVVGG